MTLQLKFTSLLLLATSVTFAQQSIVNVTRSNIKDKVAVDTVKKPVKATEQARTEVLITKSKSNLGNNKTVALDSSKTPVTTTEQARTEGQHVKGATVKCGKNPGGNPMPVGTTNDKGEVELKIGEAGNYTLTIIKASDNSQAKGQPITGANTVKVGKNPGGQMKVIGDTNEKGEVELKNMAVGTYTIAVSSSLRYFKLGTVQ